MDYVIVTSVFDRQANQGPFSSYGQGSSGHSACSAAVVSRSIWQRRIYDRRSCEVSTYDTCDQ